jgi:hypothetical protein
LDDEVQGDLRQIADVEDWKPAGSLDPDPRELHMVLGFARRRSKIAHPILESPLTPCCKME